ncbi:hypothetical protein M3225_15055 [Priestia aryabhattai]|uniref:lipopolysaccharide biosynthesis protein n=1 Tax=Priestia aryabhattai TaxID=412384 RepID=UPI0020426B1F|nr:hypothetical protein [Priestia aryabhattai]MCM3771785.1 hypothetical protein [Priestia aryabhattai]
MSKKVIQDVFLNLIATALPILILQFVCLPIISNIEGVETFGQILSLISLFTLISFPIGNVLNNINLLNNKKYTDNQLIGDFNFNWILGIFLGGVIISIVYFSFFNSFSWTTLIFLNILTILSLSKEYLVVIFRLSLNFKGILVNSFFICIGYLLGILMYFYFHFWELIYIIGMFFSVMYLIYKANLNKDSFKRTKYYFRTTKDTLILLSSSLLRNSINYADKFVILILLGPKSVSVYYTSSIIGKIILMGVNPINSVILSYLIRKEKLNIKGFLKGFLSIIVISIFSYFLIIFISPFFFRSLYPVLSEEALNIIWITAGIAILNVLSAVLQPYNLRFNNVKWQLHLNLIYAITFFLITIFGSIYWGLGGFVLSVLFSSVIFLILQVVLLINKTINHKV